MRKLTVLLVLCLAFLMTGCTLTESAKERNRRIYGVTALNSRMLVEDWDYIWLNERSSQLTQWHPHLGY